MKRENSILNAKWQRYWHCLWHSIRHLGKDHRSTTMWEHGVCTMIACACGERFYPVREKTKPISWLDVNWKSGTRAKKMKEFRRKVFFVILMATATVFVLSAYGCDERELKASYDVQSTRVKPDTVPVHKQPVVWQYYVFAAHSVQDVAYMANQQDSVIYLGGISGVAFDQGGVVYMQAALIK